MIAVTLLGPPRGKERVRLNRTTGSVYTPERTVTYEGRLAYAAQEAMAGSGILTGALRVRMQVFIPIPKSWSKKRQLDAQSGLILPTGKPDLDNYAKMLDALNQIVWVDDSQIVDLTVQKLYHVTPRCDITIEELRND